MANCEAGCLVTAPDLTFAGCGIIDTIRSGYIKNFLGLRCDETIPDITDDTAIAAQVAAGTLFLSPTLTGEVPFPSPGDPITENCQPEQNTSLTYAFNFDSYRVDNTSQTDFSKWSTIYTSLSTWTIAPVTCDNIILVPQNFGTAGVFFEMRGTIAATFQNQNFQTYRGELAFKYNDVINGVELTAAVITALGL